MANVKPEDNAFQFAPSATPMLWLYLDWETSFDDFNWRWRCIQAGAKIDPIAFPYRHCEKPLAYEFEGVAAAIEDTGANGIIVDSVGMAAGGDLNTTESAFGFLGPLRSLKDRSGQPITTLLVAHPSKDPTVRKKSMHGSAFFTNEARNVWELQAKPSAQPGQKQITLYHNKWNTTFFHTPRSAYMDWDEKKGWTQFSRADAPKDEETSKRTPDYIKAKNVLSRSGPLPIAQLAAEMGFKEDGEKKEHSINSNLQLHSEIFVKVGDSWTLRSSNT